MNLALWGHYHSYERTCAVYKDVCDPKGTTHIVVGTAGASIEKGTFGGPGFEWSKANGKEFGYLAVEATPEEMHIEFKKNSDGMVGDEVFLPNRNLVHHQDLISSNIEWIMWCLFFSSLFLVPFFQLK